MRTGVWGGDGDRVNPPKKSDNAGEGTPCGFEESPEVLENQRGAAEGKRPTEALLSQD